MHPRDADIIAVTDDRYRSFQRDHALDLNITKVNYIRNIYVLTRVKLFVKNWVVITEDSI